MMTHRVLRLTTALMLAASSSVKASVPVEGTFTAVKSCDAYQSFKKGTNPGSLRTIAGEKYEATEVNTAQDYGWVRIVVPGIEAADRWVAKECGLPDFSVSTPPEPAAGNACDTPKTHDSYVLAITWQPGFCEHGGFNGNKPECDAMASGELSVANLTLHGLWPNKASCGTRYGNCGGPPLDLSEETVSEISPWMPNFFFEKSFGAHEWNKHGVCQALDDDAFFRASVAAVKVVNDSDLGRYVRENIGGEISVTKMFTLLVGAGGPKAAKNMTIACKGKYLQEIRLSLPLSYTLDDGIKGMVGGPSIARVQGCAGDAVYVERSGPG